MPHQIANNLHLERALSPSGPLLTRLRDQKPDSQTSKNSEVFYRNLEEALDARRASNSFYSIVQNSWRVDNAVDFSSNDILSLGSSGLLREEFLAELSRNPDFCPGSGGSRLMDGNYTYLEETEQEIANFHGAEAGLIMGSGFEANVAIWSAIPRPGDVIIYDALVHASTHEGMDKSLAIERHEFQHNDVESFRETLLSVLDSQPLVRRGKRSVIIAVESVYSMDGDICPLHEFVDIAKEFFPSGNAQFVVDEAHSSGVIGPRGAGLVCELGLEKDIAIVLHTYGKAMSANGAIILGDKMMKMMVVNFARSFIFTTAPSFPFVATMRAGHNLLKSGRAEEAQERVQDLLNFFFDSMTSHPKWERAKKVGLLSVPVFEDWEERPFATHIVTIWTRQKYHYWLYFHLALSGYCVFPVEHPVVPLGQSRLKVTFHAGNTEQEVEGLTGSIFEWITEMTEIERGAGEEVPQAARMVYKWMAKENVNGFGRT